MIVGLAPWPQVRRGDTKHPVPSLQFLLREHGYEIAVDACFGAHTEAAVRRFQDAHRLGGDGVVGPVTWKALAVPLRPGLAGEAVRAVQEEAQFRNLSVDMDRAPRVDGFYGRYTEAFVRGFQEGVRAFAPALPVTGTVDVLTWEALVGGMLT